MQCFWVSIGIRHNMRHAFFFKGKVWKASKSISKETGYWVRFRAKSRIPNPNTKPANSLHLWLFAGLALVLGIRGPYLAFSMVWVRFRVIIVCDVTLVCIVCVATYWRVFVEISLPFRHFLFFLLFSFENPASLMHAGNKARQHGVSKL